MGDQVRAPSWRGACLGRVNARAAHVLSTQLPPSSSEEMGFPGACTGVTRGCTRLAEEVTQARREKVSCGLLAHCPLPHHEDGQGWA